MGEEWQGTFFQRMGKFFRESDQTVPDVSMGCFARKIMGSVDETLQSNNFYEQRNFTQEDIPILFEELSKSDLLKWGDKPAIVTNTGNRVSIEFDPIPEMNFCSSITVRRLNSENRVMPPELVYSVGPYSDTIPIEDIKYFGENLTRAIVKTKRITKKIRKENLDIEKELGIRN